ncbi:purple acid phosphatase 2-like [Capsicum galapagoense]
MKQKAEGTVTSYKYHTYTSGYIHHCSIQNLEYNTKYYYMVGIGHTTRTFWFVTPPPVGPNVPYTFGLIGDLGQTYDSNMTLTHYEMNPTKGQTVLFVGDLSYADKYPNYDNNRWDTWGRFVERSNTYQPWIWTAGNHDVDFAPEISEPEPFKPYTHRYYPVPYKVSGSSSPLICGTQSRELLHISSFYQHTPQLKRISNIEYKLINGKCTPLNNPSAPVYITVGDGGNIEGLTTQMTEPQPNYSAYRESSFGHAIMDIKNRTHACYSWHRNKDGFSAKADSFLFFNRYFHPVDESY